MRERGSVLTTRIGLVAASPLPSPGAERGSADRGGLSTGERRLIAAILLVGVALAALLMIFAPLWAVSEQDYRCPPTAPTAAAEVAASCLGAAGADGIDDRALSQARAAVRTSFGVLSAAVLAGSAAAIGVVVSNHNAALTRAALNATVKANKNTKNRDEGTAVRERERAGDERFTAAIDQLGHPSASVRLGGMHSLHRLAESDPGRLPTVVDVLCAYLRQPFHHPDHDWDPSAHPPDTKPPARAWWPASQKERDERDSEREVRSTATRLMPDLLPPAVEPPEGIAPPRPPETGDAPRSLKINLNGALLDDLDLSRRSIGDLRLDGAHVLGDLHLDGTHIAGDLHLGHGAHIAGDLHLDGTHIAGELHVIDGTHIAGELRLVGTHIGGDLRLADHARIGGRLWLDDGVFVARGLGVGSDVHIAGDLHVGHGSCVEGELRLVGTRIGGHLLLGVKARIGGGLLLDDGTHIAGELRVGCDAHIAGDLHLDHGSRVDGGVQLDTSAHIDGEVQLDDSAGEATVARRHN